MNRRGFTITEIFLVIVIMGVLGAMGYPKVAQSIRRGQVRSAASAIVAMHGRARMVAVARGRQSRLVFSSGNVKVISTNPVTGATSTVAKQNIASQFNVTITPSRDTLKFDPRGLGTEASTTTIAVSNAFKAETITVSSIGRVTH